MFSTILTRLKAQDDMLAEIHAEVKKTNGRVTNLEQVKSRIVGQATGIALAVSAIFALAKWIFG